MGNVSFLLGSFLLNKKKLILRVKQLAPSNDDDQY